MTLIQIRIQKGPIVYGIELNLTFNYGALTAKSVTFSILHSQVLIMVCGSVVLDYGSEQGPTSAIEIWKVF